MKKLSFLFSASVFLVVIILFSQCKKEHTPLNITLFDKPLPVIQSYVDGKWKLQYSKGGICGTCVWPVKHNPYLTLSSDRFVFENDSAGVIVDAPIVWKRVPWGSDSTYLLSYKYTSGYFFVEGINNDTLTLRDYASDPFYYYYTRFN